MLKRNCDYRWDTEKGLLIKWNGQWSEIEVPGYIPVEFIGAGANGVTYKALHQVTNRYDVIKVWVPGHANYGTRFLNEVQKVAKLRNNAIMIVYDGKVLPNGFCIAAYEYIEGKTLKDWLATDPPIQDRLNICREILQAVQYYQSQGVLHGDLHGKNILISRDLHPMLIDFGISAFSKEDQTKNRELYFIAALVSSLLKPCKAYNKNHFAFCAKCERELHIEPITGALTTFSFEPILMTETMQQYTELMELIEYTPEFHFRDIVAYAEFVSRSSYLDVKQLMDDTANYHMSTDLHQNFAKILDAKIRNNSFPDIDYNNNQVKKIQMSSLMAYCVMARMVHPPLINLGKENQHFKGEKDAISYSKIIDALNIWLSDAKAQDFFEVTQELQAATGESCCELYEMTRGTLFYSLDEYFYAEKLRFSYWIGAKMREIQQQDNYPQNLKNAIMF